MAYIVGSFRPEMRGSVEPPDRVNDDVINGWLVSDVRSETLAYRVRDGKQALEDAIHLSFSSNRTDPHV